MFIIIMALFTVKYDTLFSTFEIRDHSEFYFQMALPYILFVTQLTSQKNNIYSGFLIMTVNRFTIRPGFGQDYLGIPLEK